MKNREEQKKKICLWKKTKRTTTKKDAWSSSLKKMNEKTKTKLENLWFKKMSGVGKRKKTLENEKKLEYENRHEKYEMYKS